MEYEKIEVFSIPIEHRIYANGFLFKEKPSDRKLNMEESLQISDIKIVDYKSLKLGKDFKTNDGRIIPKEKLTFNPPKILSYAFCSDTYFYLPIIEHIKYVDLLYHESTFFKNRTKQSHQYGTFYSESSCLYSEKS